jgi:hypothetical protein
MMNTTGRKALDLVLAKMAADWIRATNGKAKLTYTVDQIGTVLQALHVRLDHNSPAAGYRTCKITTLVLA